MTQKEVDYIFSITIMIHEDKWFYENKGKRGLFGELPKRRDREEVQEWVAQQLATCFGVYTVPCGMSWGVIVDKDYYDEYWSTHTHFDHKLTADIEI